MNRKTITILSIIGAVVTSLIVGSYRDKIKKEAKQAEKDSMKQVKDMFKNDIPTVKAEDFLK